MEQQLLRYLSGFITEERMRLFERNLDERTNYVTVVLEDIFQPQNASAVLRSCDCFGIQNVHVIENRNKFTVNRDASMGSSKWLTVYKYDELENNSLAAIKNLKRQGFRIIATTPHTNEQLLQNIDLKKGKVALVFGSEKPGVSDIIMDEADEFLKIPMYGFTESFNISVSAALVLYEISNRLRELDDKIWRLTSEERAEIKLKWLRATVKKSHLLEELFYKEENSKKN